MIFPILSLKRYIYYFRAGVFYYIFTPHRVNYKLLNYGQDVIEPMMSNFAVDYYVLFKV